jgi:hypothetical protein
MPMTVYLFLAFIMGFFGSALMATSHNTHVSWWGKVLVLSTPAVGFAVIVISDWARHRSPVPHLVWFAIGAVGSIHFLRRTRHKRGGKR